MKIKIKEECPWPFVRIENKQFVKNSYATVREDFEIPDYLEEHLEIKSEETNSETEYSDTEKLYADYIDQNARTVRKALREDELSKDVLMDLKKLEEEDKNRITVMREIDKQLGE